MRYALITFITLAGASSALAQCPANPLTRLSGVWNFNAQAARQEQARNVNDFAIAGQFRASVGTNRVGEAVGVLTINATSWVNGSPTRLEGDAGSYQINTDCTGGTLTMNLSSYPMQYDFWFSADGQTITLVSTRQGRPAIGNARPGAAGCPVGVTNPLTLVSGAYAMQIQSIPWSQDVFTRTYARAGRMMASLGTDRAGNQIGVLDLRVTSNLTEGALEASITRLEGDVGRFQVYPNCSGGTLTMNLSSRPQQYEFYFRAGFAGLDVISTTGLLGYGVISQAATGVCPANSLSLVSGGWTFNAQGVPQGSAAFNMAIAGQWRASIGADRAGNSLGVLNINATTVQTVDTGGYTTTRLETDIGRFQIFDDCSGGTLTMNLSSFPMQYDFWFFDGGRSMYFVSTSAGRPVIGAAYSGAPTSCPVGLPTPALPVLSGPYILQLQRLPLFTGDGYTLAGRMLASQSTDRGGNPLGVLAITATSSEGTPATIVRQESDAGRYQINDDCSGGTLTFNLSSRPVQHQFYFRSGFTAADVISTTVGPSSGTLGGRPVFAVSYGTFQR